MSVKEERPPSSADDIACLATATNSRRAFRCPSAEPQDGFKLEGQHDRPGGVDCRTFPGTEGRECPKQARSSPTRSVRSTM
jgi:hypothetical protein